MARRLTSKKTTRPSGAEAASAEALRVQSPKRNRRLQRGWEGFFPYYAGYPETFAHALLESARLPAGAVVLDPWNGSGTTTLTASRLGLTGRGLDLNPVMVIVARARLLAPSEADHLKPLAAAVLAGASSTSTAADDADPLLDWFEPELARLIRAIERSICRTLVGDRTTTPDGVRLEHVSGTTATLYVALFSLCRRLVTPFQSSNPTWLRRPKPDEARVAAQRDEVAKLFAQNVSAMADELAALATQGELLAERAHADIGVADTSLLALPASSVDFILTSPPYCTRIDYATATRIELAVLHPLMSVGVKDLGRRMIGSTQVPDRHIELRTEWGRTCLTFLEALKQHPSKASAGYYYKTHVDYFDKMARSLANLSACLKPSATAVLVVQDSHYKNLHNDLPTIVGELAHSAGLDLVRRQDFHLKRSMSGIHPHSRAYGRPMGAVEAVLCFRKN